MKSREFIILWIVQTHRACIPLFEVAGGFISTMNRRISPAHNHLNWFRDFVHASADFAMARKPLFEVAWVHFDCKLSVICTDITWDHFNCKSSLLTVAYKHFFRNCGNKLFLNVSIYFVVKGVARLCFFLCLLVWLRLKSAIRVMENCLTIVNLLFTFYYKQKLVNISTIDQLKILFF